MIDSEKTYKKVLSIVIGTYNRKKFLKLTIESLRTELKNCDFSYEIILVDGGSIDGTINWLTKQKDIISIIQHNRGKWKGKAIERKSWGYFMNLGFKSAQGKYIFMLSDDCLVLPGAISNNVKYFERQLNKGKKIGAIASYWKNIPGDDNYFIIKVNRHIYVNHGVYLNAAMKEVGYADEIEYRFYAADADLCFKIIQAGYEIIACKDSFLDHFNHANEKVKNSNYTLLNKDTEVLNQKWKDSMLGGKTSQEVSSVKYLTRNDVSKKIVNVNWFLFKNNFLKQLLQRLIWVLTIPIKIVRRIIKRVNKKSALAVDKEYERLKLHVESLLKKKNKIKIHMGSGPRILKGWINVDLNYDPDYYKYYSNHEYPEKIRGTRDEFFKINVLEKGVPCPDGKVDAIFHEDFFEHLSQRDQMLFLSEMKRILKKNGVHRINTPNLNISMKDNSDFSSGMDGVYVDEWDRWHHINLVTKKSLKEMALLIGYSSVHFNMRNKSISKVMPDEIRPASDRKEEGNIFADLIK